MHAFVVRVLVASITMLGITAVARAQFQPAPGMAQPGYNVGTTTAAPAYGNLAASNLGPYGSMTTTPSGTSGSAFYADYPPSNTLGMLYMMYPQPNLGNLYGSAAVINSFGTYMIATQQARLMREQIRRDHLATRRRMIEQWLWERNNLPTTEDERERALRFQLRRSQFNPPTTEIAAGQSLNDLLNDAERLQVRGIQGQDLPLNGLDLSQINVVPIGSGAVSPGLLKNFHNGEKMTWPVGLRGDEFQKERDLLQSLLRDGTRQASATGSVDIGTLQALSRVIEQMSGQLRANLNQQDLPPSIYNPARNFLADLGSALRALGEPDAKRYVNGHYTIQAKTAADLVTDMRNKGLMFAPAAAGQQGAYVALHRLLAAYDLSLNANSMVTQAH
jgi:hypothetical protein